MKRIILAALVGVLVNGPVRGAEPDLMLMCKDGDLDRYYVLQPAKGKARSVTTDTAIEGELEVRENIYIMHFPKTGRFYEKRVKVNRYSGIMKGEFGASPFLENREGNIYFSGKCVKTAPKRRF